MPFQIGREDTRTVGSIATVDSIPVVRAELNFPGGGWPMVATFGHDKPFHSDFWARPRLRQGAEGELRNCR